MAVIALIAVGLTQNKPLPENIKVTLCVCVGGRCGETGWVEREVMVNRSIQEELRFWQPRRKSVSFGLGE